MMLLNETNGQPTGVTIEEVIRAGKFSGFVEEMATEPYHAAPYASNSFLGRMHEASPLHAMTDRIMGSKSTAAKEFGTLFHLALLEPSRFSAEYSVAPSPSDHPGALITGDDLKKHCAKLGLKVSGSKEELSTRIAEKDPEALIWDWFVKKNSGGKKVIDSTESDKIKRMVASVLSNSDAARAIRNENSKFEVSAFAIDPGNGAKVKARFDSVRFDKHIISDVKTTMDASFSAFQRDIKKYGYHRQTALYLDIYNLLNGTNTDLFLHIVVEKEAPYETAVYALDSATIEAGRAEYRHILERYMECDRTGVWPGYPKDIQTMNLMYF